MDPATVATVVELAPEVIELIQQIIENQGDDLTAENIQLIVDALYCEIEDENGLPITVSVAELASLQNQQLLELKEKQAVIDERLDSEFVVMNDGFGLLTMASTCILAWHLLKYIFGGIK